MTPWVQDYNPLHHQLLSTAVAFLPTLMLFYLLAVRKVRPHLAGISSAILAIALAVLAVGMPAKLALGSFVMGALFGWLPISWIVLNGMFLYNLTVETGQFEVIKESVGAVSPDRRIQALLIAFSFGAFIEGSAGFGTPIAICSALLVGLGFHPFYAAVLCLIANTSPVSFGSLGIPTITLSAVTNLPLMPLSQLTGRILSVVSVVVPLWLVRTMCSWRQTREVLPAILVAGVSFASTKLYISNVHGPYVVDILSGALSLILMVFFLRYWKPATVWRFPGEMAVSVQGQTFRHSRRNVTRAWAPFMILTLTVLLWGTPSINRVLSKVSLPIPIPYLHLNVVKTVPVVPRPSPEAAVYDFNWLAATGTSILTAALLSALLLQIPLKLLLTVYRRTFWQLRIPFLTIPSILGLSFVSRYSGLDSILGLAFTHTGIFYPFFGTLLGWLGVFLTGSDTASNALFGNLQKVTATQLQLSPVLMTVANSCGGVMGKMIDAQSIVIGTAATNQVGKEGDLFRKVFWHSLALAALVGMMVLLIAYVFPWIIPKGN